MISLKQFASNKPNLRKTQKALCWGEERNGHSKDNVEGNMQALLLKHRIPLKRLRQHQKSNSVTTITTNISVIILSQLFRQKSQAELVDEKESILSVIYKSTSYF